MRGSPAAVSLTPAQLVQMEDDLAWFVRTLQLDDTVTERRNLLQFHVGISGRAADDANQCVHVCVCARVRMAVNARREVHERRTPTQRQLIK